MRSLERRNRADVGTNRIGAGRANKRIETDDDDDDHDDEVRMLTTISPPVLELSLNVDGERPSEVVAAAAAAESVDAGATLAWTISTTSAAPALLPPRFNDEVAELVATLADTGCWAAEWTCSSCFLGFGEAEGEGDEAPVNRLDRLLWLRLLSGDSCCCLLSSCCCCKLMSGMCGTSGLWPRATTKSTTPRALCRILMAAWCEMAASSTCPSMARI